MLLANDVALITGAGHGIGAATARLFAAEGATVIVHYNSSRAKAEILANELGGQSTAIGADLRDPEQAEEMVKQLVGRFGKLDILVNNAASFAHDKTAETADWADYESEFTGVIGVTVNVTKAAIPVMKAQRRGRIVNTVATLLQRPAPEYIVHTTAKSALVGYSRTLARDLGPFGITVNMVSPGMTLTDYSSALPDDVKAKVAGLTPLRRLAEPEDVARVALFYASPLAEFVTAANIAPDGGLAVL